MKQYKAVLFDWDGTAVNSREADPTNVLQAMKVLLDKGIQLVIVSGTTYENICGGKLEELLPPQALQNLYLGLARGNFNYGYTPTGVLTTVQDNTPDREGALLLHKTAFQLHCTLLKEYGLQTDIVFSRPNYCKIDLMVDLPRSADALFLQQNEVERVNNLLEQHAIAQGLLGLTKMAEQLGEQNGIITKATTDAKYLEVGYTTKTDNINWCMDYFAKQGILPQDCCFLGDEFGSISPGIWGSDAQMITPTTQNCDFFDVSNTTLLLPPQVKSLGGGVPTFLHFLQQLGEAL